MKLVRKIAIFIAICLLLNMICFAYYNPAHGSDLNTYRLEPNTVGVNAVEGFGILYSDENGFPNTDKLLIEEDYILVMGSSHTKADQVMIEERYSNLLNQYLGYEEKTGVYNLGYNGGVFCDITKNFKQLIYEFPESKYIIIEVTDGQLKINEESYKTAMQQVKPEETVYGKELSEHNFMGKIRKMIKLYCPLLLLYVNQYNQWKNSIRSNQEMNIIDDREESREKREKYSEMLQLISEQYSGKIIILYHNGFKLDENDSYISDVSEIKIEFVKACRENAIDVIDMDSVWKEYFENEHIIPYGFINTSLGEGHLNKKGHELIAKEIYKYLKGI